MRYVLQESKYVKAWEQDVREREKARKRVAKKREKRRIEKELIDLVDRELDNMEAPDGD